MSARHWDVENIEYNTCPSGITSYLRLDRYLEIVEERIHFAGIGIDHPNLAIGGQMFEVRPGRILAGGLLLALLCMPGPVEARQRATPQGFQALAASSLPSVVTIQSRATVQGGSGSPGELPFGLPPGSPLDDFFGRFFGDEGTGARPAPPRSMGSLGSGFIIDGAGYIVTNNHVVADADEIKVLLHDQREFPAKVIGTDPLTDLALVKIEASGLPALKWGDSDEVKIGQWVAAIGNPFGLGGTITAGIISARSRDIGAGPYDDFLQTDAAINSGNSGGPLMNMAGEVVGIDTAIYSRSGGNVGIGFAVPSNVARPVITQIRQHGSVTRGFLGVTIQPVTPDIAKAMGLPKPFGALVASVSEGGPAHAAGIRPGDVITRFDGTATDTARALSRSVAQTAPGQTVSVTLLRDGRSLSVDARLEKLERSRIAQADGDESQSGGPLGLTVAPLSDAIRQRFQIRGDVEGVVVMAVRPGSEAAQRGIRSGDVISRVGSTAVDTPQELADALKGVRGSDRSSALLLVQRRQTALFIPVPLSEAG